jgi:hypothetical protein
LKRFYLRGTSRFFNPTKSIQPYMYTKNRFSSLITLLTSLFLLTGAASAYSITPLDEPYSTSTVGELSDSARMVEVTNNGEPVTEADVEFGFDFYYTYNASNGEIGDMQHLSEGYWYADINPELSRGKQVNYTLQETTGTEDTFYSSETLEFGNYSVELLSDTSTTLPPGETTNVRINVTDEWKDEPETGATANIYFTNGTHTHTIQNLGNQEGSEYFNGFVEVPDNFGGEYLMHINVTNTGDSIDSPSGSLSIPVTTEPPMQGNIHSFDSPGCSGSVLFPSCERSAEISTEYEVTGEEPESVNITMNVWNRSTSEWQERRKMDVQEDGNVYSADFTFPDLNTTAYGDDVQFVYNATGPETEAVERLNVTVQHYTIRFGASSSVRQGGDYNLEIAFEGLYSSKTIPRSRIEEGNISITNGTFLDVNDLKNFTLEEMEYDNGIFHRDVEIPSDWEEGTYDIDVQSQNIYGEYVASTDNFFVEDVNRTFNISGDIEDTIITGRNYSYNFTVENLGSSDLELEPSVTGELEGITWVNGTSDVFVPGDSTVNVTLNVNMSEVEEANGEVVLADNAYNDSITVDMDLPECDYRNQTICAELITELNVSSDENEEIDRHFRVYYLANENSSEEIRPDVTGNISSFVDTGPESVELNSSNNQQLVEVNYTVSGPGYYNGMVEIEDVEVPVELDSEAESQEVSFSVNESLDLGTLTESETVTREITVENTGSMTVESVSFSSDQMSVDADSIEIEGGETEIVELTLSEVSSSGSVEVTAESSQDQATVVIDVTADVVPDYSEQASTLRSRINSLQSQVSSTENQNTLNTASLNVTEVENAYNAGNYEKAERVYEATEQKVNMVEARSSTAGSQGDTQQPGSPSPSNTQEGGGSGMIIILAVVVFVLLVIGFIAYTSLIPEEGDPLYKVLGR